MTTPATLPEICTAKHVASYFKLEKENGEPNAKAVKRLVEKGLVYLDLGERTIRYRREDVLEFEKRQKCQHQELDRSENTPPTGRSSGTKTEGVSGEQQVHLAAEVLIESLQNSSSNGKPAGSVIQMKEG